MSKLIIYVKGNKTVEGLRKGDFVWNEEHKCYLWKGRVLDEPELNAEIEKAMNHFPKRLRPLVKVVEFSESNAMPAPITTISAAQEITVADAEAVMERLAPHRLKQKPGPKVVPKEMVG